MTGTVYNRSKLKNAPNWAYSVFIGKDAEGKKQYLYRSGFALKREADDARTEAIAAWKAQQSEAEAARRDPS